MFQAGKECLTESKCGHMGCFTESNVTLKHNLNQTILDFYYRTVVHVFLLPQNVNRTGNGDLTHL